jgi:ribosomal protein L37AE/L43A|tara:strand:- start:1339 stop:1518 length:180 start_codon:yes stop_codon:yes gene_type:complete
MNQKQIDYINTHNAKQDITTILAKKEELPVCDYCKEESENINDYSGMDLCSDCFSDAGF